MCVVSVPAATGGASEVAHIVWQGRNRSMAEEAEDIAMSSEQPRHVLRRMLRGWPGRQDSGCDMERGYSWISSPGRFIYH
jgi:hypothetical protein